MLKLRRFLARISIRLLAFNVLLVFLPAAGLLYLGTYERHLLQAQERAMVQQGRLLAASLSGRGYLDPIQAQTVLRHLRQRHQSRLRVIGASGLLLADSSRLGPRAEQEPPSEEPPPGVREGFLYRLGAFPFRLYRRVWLRKYSSYESGDFYSGTDRLLGDEVKAALDGRYGAATRISGGQRSVTLYTAIPIRSRGRVVGAVVVSQSTLGILQTLDAVRLEIFKVVLASVAVAIVLTLMVSTTIARPLQRLRREARAIVDRRGRLKGSFSGSTGNDEIADLARALEQLTAQLRGHIAFIEAFASDVSHEFKNPLASIRSAAEVLGEIDDHREQRRFLEIISQEVARMERLLSGVNEVTRIDAKLDEEETAPLDLTRLVPDLVEAHRRRAGSRLAFELALDEEGPLVVEASADRVAEIFENLLDNAGSFSPPGGVVRVGLRRAGTEVVAIVEDDGPGVPPEHAQRIFDRFFTYRPTAGGAPSRNGHAGLGLAIVKAIVEGYGGRVRVVNRAPGGASFEVSLPAA